MKRTMLALLLALTLLCAGCQPACTSEVATEPPAAGKATPTPTPGVLAEYTWERVSISLGLPEGWAFEPEEADDAHGIAFWRETRPELRYRLLCHKHPLAMCGTGKTFEAASFSNGIAATRVTEKIGDVLSLLLLFEDLPGNYVLEASIPLDAARQELAELGDILNTARLGEGNLPLAEAVQAAEEVCTVEYDTVWTEFDLVTGVWSVHFSKIDTLGGDQLVTVDETGTVLDSVWGE